MNILWDKIKNNWLILNRGISFEEVSERLMDGDYIEILKNPSRENQFYFIMDIDKYIWVIPFLLTENEQIVLKTAFPSRKFQKKYGDKNENQ